MQGFREFLSERQEIKKVNLNFKEVKGFTQAKRQCEKWAVELYNEGLVDI